VIAPDEALRHRILVDNPARLFGFSRGINWCAVSDTCYDCRAAAAHLAPLAGRGPHGKKEDQKFGAGEGGASTSSDSRKRPLIPTFSPHAGRRRPPCVRDRSRKQTPTIHSLTTAGKSTMTRPFEGIRVIDVTHVSGGAVRGLSAGGAGRRRHQGRASR